MVADISCKTSVFCTEITAQKGHYLENWTVSFSMTGGHFSSLGLGLECLGVLDKHQQRIYWALGTDITEYVSKMHVAAAMQQRLVLFEYSKVRGDVDLYQVLSLSAVLRSLLRLGAEFEIFAGCGTVCCSSKITMTMARDLSPASPCRGGHVDLWPVTRQHKVL